MFIWTLKASNIRFFAVVISAVALLVTVIALTGNGDRTAAVFADSGEKISFEKVKNNDDRIEFLRQFGWETDGETVEEVTLKLPGEFDRIMAEYNEIQKSQGLDLSKYKGNEVIRYTYRITNYPGYDGEVFANVIVCKNRVIGGDICSADVDGFITSFFRPEGTKDNNPEHIESTAETSAFEETGSD